MPRRRDPSKPVHPFVESLCDEYECVTKDGACDFAALADELDLPLMTILNWADYKPSAQGQYRSLYDNCQKLGMTADAFLEAMLFAQESPKRRTG